MEDNINVEIGKIIKVSFTTGIGVDGDPCRLVVQFFDMNGNRLIRKDELEREE